MIEPPGGCETDLPEFREDRSCFLPLGGMPRRDSPAQTIPRWMAPLGGGPGLDSNGGQQQGMPGRKRCRPSTRISLCGDCPPSAAGLPWRRWPAQLPPWPESIPAPQAGPARSASATDRARRAAAQVRSGLRPVLPWRPLPPPATVRMFCGFSPIESLITTSPSAFQTCTCGGSSSRGGRKIRFRNPPARGTVGAKAS